MKFISVAAGAVVAALVAAPVAQGQPQRANLVVAAASVHAPASGVPAGTSVAVPATVANHGRGRAAASRLEVVLSANAKRDGRDRVLATKPVPALAPHGSRRLKLTVRVPASVPPGPHRLLACADAKHAVRESSEKDNCRLAGRITVVGGSIGPPTSPIDVIGPPGPQPTPTPAPSLPTLSIADAAVHEGNSGTRDLVFQVSASASTTSNASAAVTVTGVTAAVGEDFLPLTGRVAITPGLELATVVVRVRGDVAHEADETLRVTLSDPRNAVIGRNQATGTIVDDDDPPPGPPAVSVDDVVVSEGDSGTTATTFTLRLSRPMPAAGQVHVATQDGTATGGSDYDAVDRVVPLAAGASSASVVVPVHGDTDVEADETFKLQLDQPAGVTIGDGSATATIQDDDAGARAPDPPGAVVLPSPEAPRDILQGQHDAPPSFSDGVSFLYQGARAIQSGTDAGAIDQQHVAVVRGRVLTAGGAPVAGARVTAAGHPELGQTATRDDGRFDLAFNGGATLTVTIERAGFMRVDRRIDITDWNAYVDAGDIVMRPYTGTVDAIRPGASEAQFASGPVVSDAAGSRRSSLLFLPGTQAAGRLATGRSVDLSSMSVRSTEYTAGEAGPDAMPGALPATSGYTYAVELSADEAVRAGAEDVRFNQPVLNYVENFLGFPAGTPVPTGYYDRVAGQWVPSRDGVVIDIVGETGGVADVDVTGDGRADGADVLAIRGIGLVERQALAAHYGPGTSLWRVEIRHFTPWDHNWPYGPPADAETPCGRFNFICKTAKRLKRAYCKLFGSIIECERQTLRERFSVPGTPYSLNYSSDRGDGRAADFETTVRATGPTVPPSLKAVRVRLKIAGRVIERDLPPDPDQTVTVRWDGEDAYGRRVLHPEKGTVELAYVYPLVYQQPATFTSSFARLSGRPMSASRPNMEVESVDEREVTLGAYDPRPLGLGGLTLGVVHRYDPTTGTAFLGNGETRAAEGRFTQALEPFAGTGTAGATGDGGPALSALLNAPRGLAVGPDGSVYVADAENDRVRRIGADGVIHPFAGSGAVGSSGDGGPATDARLALPSAVALTPEGSALIAEAQGNRIRLVSPAGVIRTAAGGGAPANGLGDGGAATAARLHSPGGVAPALGGGFYVADTDAHRVRLVGADGLISTVAGTGVPGTSADGIPADRAALNRPTGLAVDSMGRLLIADTGNGLVRRVGVDGRIETIAGGGDPDDGVGDGGSATDARLVAPTALALTRDGDVVVTDTGSGRVRRVYADGAIGTLAGAASATTSQTAYGSRLGAPDGVATHPDGRILIAERTGHRIQSIGATVRGVDEGDYLVPSDDGSEVFQFRPDGRHVRTLDAMTGGEIRHFGYDTAGRLATITSADGEVVTVERDADGNPTAIVGAHGARTELGVDAQGRIASIRTPAGATTTLSYDAAGLLSHTTRGGNGHDYGYDAGGRLVLDHGGGIETDLSHTDDGDTQVVKASVVGGSETTYTTRIADDGTTTRTVERDGHLMRRAVARPDGTVETTDADGTSATVTTAPDIRFGVGSDAIREQRYRTPGGREEVISRTDGLTGSAGNPFSFTQLSAGLLVGGSSVSATYSATSRTIASTTQGGESLTMQLDAAGRAVSAQAGDRAPVSFTYDTLGRPKTISQAGRTSTTTYAPDGTVAALTDALGREKRMVHDADGRLTHVELPGGRTVDFEYDDAGEITAVKPAGRPVQRYTYTAGGAMASASRPVASASDTSDTTTSYGYDQAGRLTTVRRPGRDAIDVAYADGVATAVTAGGRTLAGYEYDPATQELTAVQGPDARIAFDGDGPLLLAEHWSGAVDATVRHDYDSQLRVAGVSVDGAQIADYAYSADGLVVRAGPLSVSHEGGTGDVSGTTAGSLQSVLSRSQSGELSRLTTRRGASDVFDEALVRDAIGRITRSTERSAGGTHVWDYVYDAGGQLSSVKLDGAAYAGYDYDAHGNRTGVRLAGGSPATGTYDTQDKLLSLGGISYGYDESGELTSRAAGAQTTRYHPDERGVLRSVDLPDGSTVHYAIDGLGRRVGRRVDDGPWTRWVYTTEGAGPAAQLDDAGQVVSRFVYGSRNAVPDLMLRDGHTYMLVTDHIGSVRRVVDADSGEIVQALDYDPWGRVVQDTNPGFQPFGFAGGLYDHATGLVRFDAREYDAESGRWTAPDPSFSGAGDTNLYSYVGNNPVNLRDPSGRILPIVVAAGIAAGVGCGVGAASSLLCGNGPRQAFVSCVVGGVTGAVGAVIGGGVTLAGAGVAAVTKNAAAKAAVKTVTAVAAGGLSQAPDVAVDYMRDPRGFNAKEEAKKVIIDTVVGLGVGHFETGRPPQHQGRPITKTFSDHAWTTKVQDYTTDQLYDNVAENVVSPTIETEVEALSEDPGDE